MGVGLGGGGVCVCECVSVLMGGRNGLHAAHTQERGGVRIDRGRGGVGRAVIMAG